MIKVTLEIENKMAHSCSPLEYVRDLILKDAKTLNFGNHGIVKGEQFYYNLDTPYAKIKIIDIEQI
jgi:hypothetical protein